MSTVHLSPYARQNGADGAAIFGGGIGELDDHFGVLRYQICAFLRTTVPVYRLVQVVF